MHEPLDSAAAAARDSGSATAVPPATRSVFALASAALVGLIWAGWIVVSAHGLQRGFTPYDLTLLRFLVPALITFPWLFRNGLWRDWRKLLIVGVFVGAPHSMLIQLGLAETSTAHGAVLLPGLVPIWTGLFGWWVLRERPTLAAVVGLVLILSGIFLIVLSDAASIGELSLIIPGDLYFVAGAAVWGYFTVAIRVWRMKPMETAAVVSVMSALVYTPVYLIWLPANLLAPPVTDLVIQALYQGVLGIVVAIALYAVVVEVAGAQRAATISAAVPILALLLALVLLSEVPTWLQLAGALVCGLGIWMVVVMGNARRTKTDPPPA